ncbi:basic helix-loop-helix DNA-binding superfamily protein [Perilla frutescens var. hirtella]|nr:basic helix-loop-helix DNA-binding superfamily protein [Perilla frutescens var. hirtella]KAH6811809.1 basic helix-loop-helix DNA-binding superfamily protein [Perilla frutescens var. frutescens]
MAGNAGFGDDPLAPGCYSQLLFSDEISGLETDGCFGFTSSLSSDDNNTNNLNTPKMLCFGDYAKLCGNGKKPDQKPGFTCMASSPKNIHKKRNGSSVQNAGDCGGAPTGNQRNGKKPKSENSTGGGHAKVVKKEKLGERITALQQLVSPFGKTDTASVLHEALGYIRFLHDQVQVLCSPYLQRWSPEAPHTSDDGESKKSERSKDDLRSRGLCLVPVDLTLHVADSNGADLWSSAAVISTVSSS